MSVYLDPVPAEAGVLTLYYYRLPTARATADTSDASLAIEVPDGFDDLVADYAEMRALRNDADPRWQDARSIYEDKLNALIVLTTRPVDGMALGSSHPCASTGNAHV
jgi:hypothetical protein